MDYEKIIDTTGSKEFWNKYSELKKNLINALEKANTGAEQCNLPVVSKFDFKAFKNYVDTYDPKRHGLNKPDTIVKDLLYGIGIHIDKKFECFDGFKNFMNWLKANF